MKKKRVIIWLAVGLFALLGTGIIIPFALSYLSDLEDQGIAIRAANAAEIWDMTGSFDEAGWTTDGGTGIFIKNVCHKDLWIFYEYTGDLKQVFKQSGPVLVKAGENREVVLQPLDGSDSPRILNPLDIIEYDISDKRSSEEIADESLSCSSEVDESKCECFCNWDWKEFTGTVKIDTLNCYATLEAEKISISGESLWDLYFDKKYGIDPQDFYNAEAGKTIKIYEVQESDDHDLCENDLRNTALSVIDEGQEFLRGLADYTPLDFIQQVVLAVEKIAPGLWEEHDFLQSKLLEAAEKLEEAYSIIDNYIAEQKRLRGIIEDQKESIYELQQELNSIQSGQTVPESIGVSDGSPAAAELETGQETAWQEAEDSTAGAGAGTDEDQGSETGSDSDEGIEAGIEEAASTTDENSTDENVVDGSESSSQDSTDVYNTAAVSK